MRHDGMAFETSSAPEIVPSVRLSALDALRGLASIGVVFFHLSNLFSIDVIATYNGVVRLLWYNLNTLVDLFFVISGFIFSHVYLTGSGSLRPHVTVRNYAVARFARLYPLHLVGLLTVAVIISIRPPSFGDLIPPTNIYDPYHFVLNILFLQGSGLEKAFSFDSPSWSLTAEALCYILFFIVASRLPRWLIPLSLAFIALAVISQTIAADPLMSVKLARGLTGFFVGVIACRYKDVLLRRTMLLTAVPLIVALVLAKSAGSRLHLDYGMRLSLLPWPLLVLLVLRKPFAAVLDLRPFQLIGDLSFSIYLVHLPVMLAFLALHAGAPFDPRSTYWLFPTYLLVVGLISWLSFTRLETPARKWLNGLERRMPRRTGAADVF